AKDAISDAYMERLGARLSSPGVAALATARETGLARLKANLQVNIVDNPELGTPEVVGAKPGSGFLTGPSSDRVAAMRTFLSTYPDTYGVSPQQIGNLVLVADYQNPAGNMAWVEFEQRINNLPVFRGLIRGGFTVRGELARTTGQLVSAPATLIP